MKICQMKEVLFVFLILFLSFAYCGSPTSERTLCEHRIADNETDLFSYSLYLLMYSSTVTEPARTTDPTTQKQLADIVLIKCLIAVQNEQKCSNKSRLIPVWESPRSQ